MQLKVMDDEAVGRKGVQSHNRAWPWLGGRGMEGHRQWGKTWGGNFISSLLMGQARNWFERELSLI